MQPAWLSSPMTGSLPDWNDRGERGGQEIEFPSFPPGFLPFPFSRTFFSLPPPFFTSRVQEPFHRSCYHTGIALDSRTFGVTITATYESRIITCAAISSVEREARVLCKLLVEREFDTCSHVPCKTLFVCIVVYCET